MGSKLQADYGQTSHHDGGDPHFSLGYGSDLWMAARTSSSAPNMRIRRTSVSVRRCATGANRRPAPMMGTGRYRLPCHQWPAALHHRTQRHAGQPEPDRRSHAVQRAGARRVHPDRPAIQLQRRGQRRRRPSIPVPTPTVRASSASARAPAPPGVGAYDGTTLRPAVKR